MIKKAKFESITVFFFFGFENSWHRLRIMEMISWQPSCNFKKRLNVNSESCVKGPASWHSCMGCFLCFVTFPCGVLGQVWYLIVSIPDLRLLTFLSCFLLAIAYMPFSSCCTYAYRLSSTKIGKIMKIAKCSISHDST